MTLKRSIGLAAPLALGLAIGSAGLQHDGARLSAALSLCWVVLATVHNTLAQPQNGTSIRAWPFAIVLLLALNIRGIVMKEGPQPVSHMDFVLLIAAVLAGQGQSRVFWRTTLSTVSLTIASCGALRSALVWQHLFDNKFGLRLGDLLVNQTAMLTGLGCISGLAALQLWLERLPIATADNRSTQTFSRIGILVSLGLSSMTCAAMTFATHSRAGIGLIPISLLCSWFLQKGARQWLGITKWLRNHMLSIAIAIALTAGIPILWLTSPQGTYLRQTLTNVYGGENRVSDQGRLDLWRCYASLPFQGNNWFLYGVGYGRARELCPIRLPNSTKPLSHAHNLPLQIWAEAGTLPMALILAGAVQFGRRIVRQQGKPKAMALSSPLIYGVLFNLVELGMLKVPVLTVLFGYLFSGPLIGSELNASAGGNRPEENADNGGTKEEALSKLEPL